MDVPNAETRMPLRRLLVPTDFSRGAESALRRALLFPGAEHAIVHVVHVLSPEVPAKLRGKATKDAKRTLEETVSLAREGTRGATPRLTSEVRTGEPFVEIIRCARQIDAELIVLGRHGRRPVRDLFIGTTAARVIRKGDVPVLVVNTKAAGPYRRPLIATDLDDCAPRVFGLALRILEPTVEFVRVVHAFHVPFEGFATPRVATRGKSEYRRFFHDEAKAGLSRLLARYEDTGLRWKTTIRSGDPRSIVLSEVVGGGADLVALGTHGRSGVAHALVGSVAEFVISRSPCDVLVARPARFSFALP